MKIERDDAKVGLMVLVAVALFAALFLHRSLSAIAARETRLQVRLTSASDVVVGTEVQLQGYRVGQVSQVDLERRGVEYTILATLTLPRDLALWKGTRAVINTRVLGGASVELVLSPLEARTAPLDPSEILEGTRSASLAALVEQVQGFVRNLDQGVSEVRNQLQRKGAGVLLDHPAVNRTLGNLDGTLREYRSLAQGGQHSLQALDRNLASAQKSLAAIEGLLERRSPELDAIVVNLDATLREMNALSSDAGKFMKEGGPEAEAALRALRRDLESAGELLELLKAKPSRVLWGKPSQAEQEAAKQKAEMRDKK